MDTLVSIWQWFLQFAKGDLPSWLAIAIAVIAMLFALRRPGAHTELSMSRLHFDDEGGPISLDMELTTYRHAPRLSATAKLKLDRVKYPLKLQPVNSPTNYQFATVNTFHLSIVGQYTKRETLPKMASIDVKARLSDGSKARLRENMPLTPSSPSTEDSPLE